MMVCLILTHNVIRIYPSLADVSFHIVAYMHARFRYSGKNPMRFAVFWRISVRFCGFRTPLTPPSSLTIVPRGRVGYEMIANEARSAELAISISYSTSASGIIVLLKTPTKSRWISPTRTNRKRKYSLFTCHTSIKTVNARADSHEWKIKTL